MLKVSPTFADAPLYEFSSKLGALPWSYVSVQLPGPVSFVACTGFEFVLPALGLATIGVGNAAGVQCQ